MLTDEAMVSLRIVVGLPGDDEVEVGQLFQCLGQGLQEDVQPLVLADEAKEETYRHVVGQVERGPCLCLRDGFSKPLVDGVLNAAHRGIGVTERVQVVGHGVGHHDVPLAGREEELTEPRVPKMPFVGQRVVDDGNRRNAVVPLQAARDDAVRRSEERHPVLKHHRVRRRVPQTKSRPKPRERIQWIEHPRGLLHNRWRLVIGFKLRRARK